MIVWDIETGPLSRDEILAASVPFDRAEVKIGLRKEETAEVYRDKMEEKHEATQYEKAALSATTGQVIAIGYYGVDTEQIKIDGQCSLDEDGTEKSIIERFWQKYSKCHETGRTMAGFNIFHFDLPFLIRRSWKLGISIPPTAFDKRFDSIFIDLMKQFTFGKPGEFVSLDAVARFFGAGQKNGDGKEFAKLWTSDNKKAVEYLTNDLTMTAGVAAAMGVV